jgi:hypothetical protein
MSVTDVESPEPLEFGVALAALKAAYTGIDELSARLSPADLLEFSRCRGWVVADVLYHLLSDAQRALVALASPAPGPPDRDFVSYWSGFADVSRDWVPGALWVRRSAAAFRDGTGVISFWQETAPAAVRSASRADPEGHVKTQGHVLAVPDLLATLAVEAVIHHLDMTVHVDAAPEPADEAVAIATRTLDGLFGVRQPHASGTYPAGWSAQEYLLKATGRLTLTGTDRAALGTAADLIPLLS